MTVRCFALIAVVVLVACAPRLERGAACTLRSECPRPYACVGGRCIEECRTQADCTIPGRCVLVNGVGGCFFDEVDRCSMARDCGDDPALVCQGGACFNSCERCAEVGAVCQEGVCVRSMSTDAGMRRDGGGAPVFEDHDPCSIDDPCSMGFECVGDNGAQPACREPCTSAVGCASQICARPADDLTVAFCGITCNPLDPSSCPGTDTCDRLDRIMPGGDTTYVWGCRPVIAPVIGADEPCSAADPNRCVAGTRCSAVGARGNFCLEYCDTTPLTCRDGRSCERVHLAPPLYPAGLCQPPSMSM